MKTYKEFSDRLIINRHEGSYWTDKNVLKLDYGEFHLRIFTKNYSTIHLKEVNFINFMIYKLQLNKVV